MEISNKSTEIPKNCEDILMKHIEQDNYQNGIAIDESIYNLNSLDIVKDETINVNFTWCGDEENYEYYVDNELKHKYEIDRPKGRPGKLSSYTVTFTCTECDFTCNDINTLVNHKLVHRKSSHFICPVCGDKFNNIIAVNLCINKHKPSELNPKSNKIKEVCITSDILNSSTSQKFTCGLCNHSCIGSQLFVEHMNIHIQKKIHCYQCNTTFRTFTALKKHSEGQDCQTHQLPIPLSNYPNQEDNSVSKKYQCLEYQKKIISKNILENHSLSHRKTKYRNKIKCSECEYKCESINDLEQHMYSHESNHSEDEQFECSLCDYVSSSEKDIQEHSMMCDVNGISESHENSYENGISLDISTNVITSDPRKENSTVNSQLACSTKSEEVFNFRFRDNKNIYELGKELSDKSKSSLFVGNSVPIFEVGSLNEINNPNNKVAKTSEIASQKLNNLSYQSFDIFIPIADKLKVNNTSLPTVNDLRISGYDNDAESDKNNLINFNNEKDNEDKNNCKKYNIGLSTRKPSRKRKIKEILGKTNATDESNVRNKKSKEGIRTKNPKKKLKIKSEIKSENSGICMYLSLSKIKRLGSLIKENKEINVEKKPEKLKNIVQIKADNTKIYIPEGWTRKLVRRTKKGDKNGDIYYFSPDGKKHRSKVDIVTYLTQPFASVTGKVVNVDRLNFGYTGLQKSQIHKKHYTCSKCEYRTEYLLNIKYHLICTLSDDFACSECNYKSKRKDLLYAHMKKHVVIYVYYCKDCEYTSTNKIEFQSHKSIHESADMKKSDLETEKSSETSESDQLKNKTKPN